MPRLQISVIVSNYNYGRFLAETIASVLSQLGPEDEIIVVDDGSTDESREILKSLAGASRLRIILQRNSGSLDALANGLTLARNEIVTFLDADDWYLEGHLERVRTLFEEHREIDFAFARGRIHAAPGSDPRASAAILRRMEYPPGPVGSNALVAALASDWVGSPTSGLALRRPLARAIFERVGVPAPGLAMFPDAVLVRGADLLGARKYALAEAGFGYRIHGANHHRSLREPFERWRQRRNRTRSIRNRCLQSSAPDSDPPSASALADEAKLRAWPCSGRARIQLALIYVLLAVRRCRGSFRQRVELAIAAARRAVRNGPARVQDP
ncbi:glycosyltransferase family 2 protein [Thioalkalivibrio paradoxus]|uniref:glycosyltransferase family 2 protein n=1 Tax=Thioalkalivibrio paradoxus TaxID=108010 RepID=UPI0018DD2EDA|nr:glycosyltransferase family A protein [Thioalkalivibrio paradoxus]